MATGTVKWFNFTKGFGFINEDGSEEDIFVHANNIKTGTRSLQEGQRVKFEAKKGPKGLEAHNVTGI